MRKYILSISGLLAAIFSCAFKNTTVADKNINRFVMTAYAVFDSTGDQRDCSKYSIVPGNPGQCPGSNKLCWFLIRDCDMDGDIDCDDFYCSFDEIDSNGNGSLDDQIENHTTLEKKF